MLGKENDGRVNISEFSDQTNESILVNVEFGHL